MKPLAIDSPCHASWDAMRNAGTGRHCAACDKRVFDLSRLTERQIAGLALVSGGSFCGRQRVVDGALVVRPEPPPARTRSSLWPIRVAAVAGALSAAACSPVRAEPGSPNATPITMSQGATPVVLGANTSAPSEGPLVVAEGNPPREEIMMMGEIAYVPTLPSQVTFARGSSRLNDEARQLVRAAYDFLRDEPTMTIAIEGHLSSDEVGKSGKRLAAARAEAVKSALVKLGIDGKRLRTSAAGAERPIVRGASESEQRQNRRVEMRICDGETCPPV